MDVGPSALPFSSERTVTANRRISCESRVRCWGLIWNEYSAGMLSISLVGWLENKIWVGAEKKKAVKLGGVKLKTKLVDFILLLLLLLLLFHSSQRPAETCQ